MATLPPLVRLFMIWVILFTTPLVALSAFADHLAARPHHSPVNVEHTFGAALLFAAVAILLVQAMLLRWLLRYGAFWWLATLAGAAMGLVLGGWLSSFGLFQWQRPMSGLGASVGASSGQWLVLYSSGIRTRSWLWIVGSSLSWQGASYLPVSVIEPYTSSGLLLRQLLFGLLYSVPTGLLLVVLLQTRQPREPAPVMSLQDDGMAVVSLILLGLVLLFLLAVVRNGLSGSSTGCATSCLNA